MRPDHSSSLTDERSRIIQRREKQCGACVISVCTSSLREWSWVRLEKEDATEIRGRRIAKERHQYSSYELGLMFERCSSVNWSVEKISSHMPLDNNKKNYKNMVLISHSSPTISFDVWQHWESHFLLHLNRVHLSVSHYWIGKHVGRKIWLLDR